MPSDTVKRIVSDLLNEPTVIDYLRTNLISQDTSNSLFDDSPHQRSMTSLFSPQQNSNLLPNTTTMIDEYDPLWLEFIQSLNHTNVQIEEQNKTAPSIATVFNDDEDDDEEFIGPEEENPIDLTDEKKLRVSKRELALLLKESTASPDEIIVNPDEELLPSDQYESLWTDFLASLQRENGQPVDEQPKSIVTTVTEEDDNDDPEFRLPDTDYDVDDDLDDELHVSRRELALLLQDKQSLFNPNEFPPSEEILHPESVASTTSSSTIRKLFEHQLTTEQREIFQYQFSAYVQLLTQYILLRRETQSFSDHQLFKDLICHRDRNVNSIVNIPLLTEAQRLLESPQTGYRRKALGNHLPFHLMDTFCKSSAFLHESLLPTCLLSSSKSSSSCRSFVSGEDCLMALGLEQNDVHLLIIGHTDKDIQERINSLRYARVRRGKQNPIRAFYTYGSVPDSSLTPWYQIPSGFDVKQIYPHGLLEKSNVIFPPWFRLSYKRSRQLSKREHSSLLPSNSSTNLPTIESNESPSSSTVYVVVEGTSTNTRSTSPKKVLQQIHMLHLLNSYPKLQPRQRPN